MSAKQDSKQDSKQDGKSEFSDLLTSEQIEIIKNNPILNSYHMPKIELNNWSHWMSELSTEQKRFVNKVRQFDKYLAKHDSKKEICVTNVPLPIGFIDYARDFVTALYPDFKDHYDVVVMWNGDTVHKSELEINTTASTEDYIKAEKSKKNKKKTSYLIPIFELDLLLTIYYESADMFEINVQHELWSQHIPIIKKAIADFNKKPDGKCIWDGKSSSAITFVMN
jgi:hypothetical protein